MTIYGRSARLLRRYGPWTLVVTAVTVAAAYGLHRSAPATYRSEASVLVTARPAGDGTPISPRLDTERAVLLSDAVALPAAQRVGLSRDAMVRDLTVEIVPGSDVLRLLYSAGNPHSAQVRNRALTESYLAFRNAVTPGTATTPAAATGPVRAEILSDAGLPTSPERRPLLPDLAAGLGLGLLLGAGGALLRARTRGRIRSREDFAELTGTTVLATIPGSGKPAGATTGLPVLMRSPTSAAAESYRYLRTRLQPALRSTDAATILVTSPGDRQGRTTVAANLAVALAQTGRSVVLVDADLRRPVLHQVFQVPGEYGLTTLLDGDATVSEVLEETTVPRLRLLPLGHRTGEHVDLLESPQLARVLRAVQKHCDVVVLDSSAVLSASDAIALAALSDQVLLVGDFRRTTRISVRRALAELAEVVDGNLSTVLLNVPKSAGGLTPRARELSAVAAVPFSFARARAPRDHDSDLTPAGARAPRDHDSDLTPATPPLSGHDPHTPTPGLDSFTPAGLDPHVFTPHTQDTDEPPYAMPTVYGTPVSSTVYSSAAAASATTPTITGLDILDSEEDSPAELPAPDHDDSSPAEETEPETAEEDREATAVLKARS